MTEELEFKKETLLLLKNIKNGSFENGKFSDIPVYKDNIKIALLIPLMQENLIYNEENKKIVKLLGKWREQNSRWFDIFKVTEEGTKKWLKEKVIDCDDRILFLIKTMDGLVVGHIGFYRFDFKDYSCELDNVMRGEKTEIPGLMTYVTKTILDWAFERLKLKSITLRTFSDNEKAIALYERCGFKKVKDIPLEKIVGKDSVRWEEITDGRPAVVDRYFSQYIFKK